MNLFTEGFVQHTQARPIGNSNRVLLRPGMSRRSEPSEVNGSRNAG